ncbi:MAG UNVERIFIED_CONTAM: hypothetical protein LVT10_02805 [Anaerolineae bacterium]|jgi:hypothetical protein
MPVFVGWAMRDGLVQWSRNRDAVTSIPGALLVRFEHWATRRSSKKNLPRSTQR